MLLGRCRGTAWSPPSNRTEYTRAQGSPGSRRTVRARTGSRSVQLVWTIVPPSLHRAAMLLQSRRMVVRAEGPGSPARMNLARGYEPSGISGSSPNG